MRAGSWFRRTGTQDDQDRIHPRPGPIRIIFHVSGQSRETHRYEHDGSPVEMPCREGLKYYARSFDRMAHAERGVRRTVSQITDVPFVHNGGAFSPEEPCRGPDTIEKSDRPLLPVSPLYRRINLLHTWHQNTVRSTVVTLRFPVREDCVSPEHTPPALSSQSHREPANVPKGRCPIRASRLGQPSFPGHGKR